MEENKICKCCCSESRGGWLGGLVCVMLDGKGSRQSNQSIFILANTFRTIHEKDELFENLVIPCWCDSDKVDWKLGGDQWSCLQMCNYGNICLPASKPHCKFPTKCPPFTVPLTGQHPSFSLPFLNPLGFMERLWNMCCVGVRELTFAWFPRRGETLSITALIPPRFRLSSVWVSWLLPYVSCLRESERVHGWQERMRERLTKY